ncbi:hypothetical protein [Intestinibacter bartlettii]|uniref:EF-hand domain-containing protein n=1 Tax=Intestinibacter bartlettii TaxID=261299 RepID=A0ABS6DVU7_9FIRM|nr:hypothetical protein [Intestinibacter bartlettii]MBU5335965.1 hypothetical protein [Intestinibacter bartlettii]
MLKKNTIKNSEKDIREYELLKHFYFKKQNIITEEEFEKGLKDYNDVSRDRLLKTNLLQVKDSELEISPFGISVVELFTRYCDDCGELVYCNAFLPISVCTNCGSKMEAAMEVKIDKEVQDFAKGLYKDLLM